MSENNATMFSMLSERGFKLLVFEGFKFSKNRRTLCGQKWRCTNRKCSAHLFTDDNGNELLKAVGVHNHEPCSNLHRHCISNSVKRKVTETLSELPDKVIKKEISSDPKNISSKVTTDDIDLIRRNLNYAKRSKVPPLPRCIADIHNALDSIPIKTTQADELLMERGMVNVNLVYGTHVTDNDPRLHPVLIVGQIKNLNRIKFDDVKCKLGGRVSEEDFQLAVKRFSGSHNDPVNLYLNYATIAPLPDQASRHNAPARPHSLTKVVKSETFDVDGESIVVVCERKDVFASGCAVARAFPLYSRKFARVMENTTVTVTVEFLVLEEDGSVSSVTREEAATLQSTADGIRLAARIVDTPCNEMNVDVFVNEVQQVAQLLNVNVSVIRGVELKEKGMGGIYGVGKAATCPPALAVLSYLAPGATQTIAWVGKGIVFDTGGLSIKSKTDMPGMKRDCGGAAAILGAFYATVKQGFSQNLHAVFCLAENSVGPNATRPDDVHTLYSGRTVEINNTDAEGRLVLADGVVYASRDLKADLILDMATLTGAQGISTGKYHSAVLTNSSEWENNVVTAGRTSGDLAFPIVYCPELHFSEFSSAIADMKNSVADRQNAQSSCAGLFVAAHLGFDFPGVWIHVDMASPVHVGERATGYGVALLTALFGGFSLDRYLKYVGENISLNCAKHSQTNLS